MITDLPRFPGQRSSVCADAHSARRKEQTLLKIDMSGSTPSQLVCWLAAQCHDGNPKAHTAGGLGPMGAQALDDFRDLAPDVAQSDEAPAQEVDLGIIGNTTLDDLRAP